VDPNPPLPQKLAMSYELDYEARAKQYQHAVYRHHLDQMRRDAKAQVPWLLATALGVAMAWHWSQGGLVKATSTVLVIQLVLFYKAVAQYRYFNSLVRGL
jgi:RsiW-degrading membrane proteinase PrsW (M82 family)